MGVEGPEEIKVHDNARPEAVGGTTGVGPVLLWHVGKFPARCKLYSAVVNQRRDVRNSVGRRGKELAQVPVLIPRSEGRKANRRDDGAWGNLGGKGIGGGGRGGRSGGGGGDDDDDNDVQQHRLLLCSVV